MQRGRKYYFNRRSPAARAAQLARKCEARARLRSAEALQRTLQAGDISTSGIENYQVIMVLSLTAYGSCAPMCCSGYQSKRTHVSKLCCFAGSRHR